MQETQLPFTLESLQKALEMLTPGGSEFYNDPQRCIEFLKHERANFPKLLLEKKRENDILRTTIHVLSDTIENVIWNFEGKQDLSPVQLAAIKQAKEALSKIS